MASAKLLQITLLLLSLPSCAQKPGGNTSKTRFLDATVQTSVPGRQESAPTTSWKLLLIWGEIRPPQRFAWQPRTGAALNCAVQKIHHYTQGSGQQLEAYGTTPISLNEIRRGDTLELIPVPASKSSLTGVRHPAAETLYYQTTVNKAWRSLRPSLRRLKDIIMP